MRYLFAIGLFIAIMIFEKSLFKIICDIGTICFYSKERPILENELLEWRHSWWWLDYYDYICTLLGTIGMNLILNAPSVKEMLVFRSDYYYYYLLGLQYLPKKKSYEYYKFLSFKLYEKYIHSRFITTQT